MRGREQFSKYRMVLSMGSAFFGILPKKVRRKLFESFRDVKGKAGLALRYMLIKTLASSVGENVAIFPGVYILNPEGLRVGNNVSIHPMCYVEAFGGIAIGDDVSIAHMTTLLSVHHVYDDPKIPIRDQGIEKRPLVVCDNVWIGAKATLLGGVTVERGAIVAAGAVVSHNVEENCIVGGVPAKLIRKRCAD